jgi:serine phosphatase RsbU (regulator of sigma subunit)
MELCELLLSDQADEATARRRVNALLRLLDVTRVLAAEVDLDKILEVIAREACQALVCERASLYQYDPKRNELYTRVATDLEIAEIRRGLEDGITGYVARHRQMVNVPDPALDPRWHSAIDQATGFQTRSILAAPLTSSRDNALLGVLQCLNNEGGPFDDFDEQLLSAFSQHAAVALDRARLVEELREREAIDASLNVARDVQRGFMPSQLPQIHGYEAATWWFPNQAVGGDYCDVLSLPDGRLGLVVADVSGHGLGPSLLMASVRAALRALLLEHAAPEQLLALLGRALAPDLQNGLFITMVIASLDPDSHTVCYSNAGHAPAEHYSAAADRFTTLHATGMPLGVVDEPDYPPGPVVSMEVGDLLVLCTDGIVEAVNSAGEQFGQARLLAALRELRRLPLAELVARVGERIEDHYEGASPADDLTILALRRNQ